MGSFIPFSTCRKITGGGNPPTQSFSFLSGALPSGLTFARASSATYYNSSGLITSATSGTARFDYNPNTLALNGMLMEAQSTNLTFPSVYAGATWSTNQAALTANAATSPDGTNNAALFSDIATNFPHVVSLAGLSTTNGVVYAFSVYAKQGTQSVLQMATGAFDFSGNAYANFNLATGAITAGAAATAAIQNVGNGWYRCTVFLTATATGFDSPIFCLANNNMSATRAPSYSGTGSGNVYLYGAQIETASKVSSYIPTTSTTVTRAADQCYTTSLSWFNASAGSLVVNALAAYLSTTAANYLASFSDATTNNNIDLLTNTSGNAQAIITVASSATSSGATSGATPLSTLFRQKLAYTNAANIAFLNTTQDTAGTYGASAIPSGITRFDLCNREDGTLPFNGWLQSVRYWNTALSAATLGAIT